MRLFTIDRQFVFATHASLSPASATTDRRSGVQTDVEIATASVADAAARQSAKFAWGRNVGRQFQAHATFEHAATPIVGGYMALYANESPSGTAANANLGGTTGADAAYAGYSSNLESSLTHLKLVGISRTTVQATTTMQQVVFDRLYTPSLPWGSLVLVNRSGAAMHSDGVETHIVLSAVDGPLADKFAVRSSVSASDNISTTTASNRLITVQAGALPIILDRIRVYTSGAQPAKGTLKVHVMHYDSGSPDGTGLTAYPIRHDHSHDAEFSAYEGSDEGTLGAFSAAAVRLIEPMHNQVGTKIHSAELDLQLEPAEIVSLFVESPVVFSGFSEVVVAQPEGYTS